ncbi:hypothetical protein LSTR_LSTR016015 [Laodelphax striatellus]|uniref:Ints3-like C-terminal domain-containing protein n=1 Tax=Laodelphax striatellus TaxID=195883 RepID=A0A482WHI2_LAOST|nr:hypothetical protein LSTR_LSTR016015 [Laodelphax striatellus]
MFCWLIPGIYSTFPEAALGNGQLMHLIVSSIDSKQLQDLVFKVIQGRMVSGLDSFPGWRNNMGRIRGDCVQWRIAGVWENSDWNSVGHVAGLVASLLHTPSPPPILSAPWLPKPDQSRRTRKQRLTLSPTASMLKQHRPTADLGEKAALSRDRPGGGRRTLWDRATAVAGARGGSLLRRSASATWRGLALSRSAELPHVVANKRKRGAARGAGASTAAA